jgi:hypothetical protein
MKPNYFIFSLSEMMEYVRLCRKGVGALDWDQILELKGRPNVTFIQVVDESNKTELAFAGWGWDNDEIKSGKIHVDKSLQKQGIADTIMKMFIAIAKSNNASKITGVIDGDGFLWDWYKKLGFTVYDGNKLLMELRISR